MKKTLLTLSVFLAVICYTLAYAATGQGSLALFDNSSVSATETKSTTVDNERNTLVRTPMHGMQINLESLHRATSRVAILEAKMPRKVASSRQNNVEEVVVDLWNTAFQIYMLNDGATFDSETNTISFPGSVASSNQIFMAVSEEGNYGWNAIGGQTYNFTGTLTSNGNADVYPCIIYHNGNGLYIKDNITINLNESNGFTSDFTVTSTGIQDGYPIMVAFLVENSTPETTITATNNQFWYSYTTVVAQEWNSDNDLPGLGLAEFGQGRYTVTLEDEVTTLGLYYYDGSLYVTGINTIASEVVLPKNVTVFESVMQIDCLGYYNKTMDWSGAANLTILDASSVNQISASFSGLNLTDLYIGMNSGFSNSISGIENTYLHIPYGASRSNYTYYDFKRVLVGDEQPNYPVASNSDWVIAGDNEGDYFGISTYDGYYCVREIFTGKETIDLPVATPANGGMYYIRYFGNDGSYSSVLCQNASSLKAVTIPQSYSNLRVNWSYSPIVDLHMQGDVPNTNWNLTPNMTVYVGNQSYYTNYENNSSWNRAAIVPEGWEFEWMTVNVGRKGEFAQTYIEMTDANWALGMYVKITGTLNTTDLQNINL